MAIKNVAAPRLPEPTREYSLTYMQDLIRALEIFIEQERTPGDLRARSVFVTNNLTDTPNINGGGIRASTMNLQNLPTSSSGLSTGDVWNDSGTLKIVP